MASRMGVIPGILPMLDSLSPWLVAILPGLFDSGSLFPRVDLGFLHTAVGGVIITSTIIVTVITTISFILSELASQSAEEDY